MKNRMLFFLLLCTIIVVTGCPRKDPNRMAEIVTPEEFEAYEGVQVKKVVGEKLAVIRCEDYIGRVIDNLSDLIKWMITSQAEIIGPNTTIFYAYPGDLRRDDLDRSLLYMVGFPVHDRTLGYGKVKIFVMKDYLAACVLHRGAYTNIGESYEKLLNWVNTSGYKREGFFREVYISGPGPRDPVDPNLWLTELQVQISK